MYTVCRRTIFKIRILGVDTRKCYTLTSKQSSRLTSLYWNCQSLQLVLIGTCNHILLLSSSSCYCKLVSIHMQLNLINRVRKRDISPLSPVAMSVQGRSECFGHETMETEAHQLALESFFDITMNWFTKQNIVYKDTSYFYWRKLICMCLHAD